MAITANKGPSLLVGLPCKFRVEFILQRAGRSHVLDEVVGLKFQRLEVTLW
jgi:hypothetical protein